jgi:hypothetical protein
LCLLAIEMWMRRAAAAAAPSDSVDHEEAARVARLEANPAPVVRVPIPVPAPAVAPLSVRPTPLARQSPDDWRTYTDAARWLEQHGIPTNTSRQWDAWRGVIPLERSAVLRDAIRREDPANWRITWRLHRCSDSLCPCRELLPA